MTESRRSARIAGRAVELTRLDTEFRSVRAGRIRVILIVGEPGVGKTRLASEFQSRHRRDTTGLQARGYPTGSTAAFSLWIEALEGQLRTLGPDEVVGLGGAYAADLATLLPSFGVAGEARPPTARPSRSRNLEALTALVEAMARTKPLVVTLDDVHLADPSSWEALSYVAHNAAASRILFVLTARPAELEQDRVATELLLALEQEDILARLPLEPLGRDELHELALESLPPDQAPTEALMEWLVDRSRGNPLFALGLLNVLLDSGADLSVPESDAVPAELRERMAITLQRLDDAARDLLELLSVIGRRTEISELVGLSGLDLESISGPLDRLGDARLIVVEEQGRQVDIDIVHPLVQEAIYGRIGVARRRMLHRKVARALVATGSSAEAAGHFARSASVGDIEAIEALREAFEEAEAAGAYPEALAIMAALVELIPSGDHRWLDVLDALSPEAEWVVEHRADGDAAKGVEALREIDALLEESGDPGRRANVKFRLASFLAWGLDFDLDEAERFGRVALALYQQAGDRAGELLTMNELAWGRTLRGHFAEHESEALAIAATAEAESHRFVAIQALGGAGYAAMVRGRFDRAELSLMRCVEIARADAKHYRVASSLSAIALVRASEGRITEALAVLEEAHEAHPLVPLRGAEAVIQLLGGDLPGAVRSGRQLLAASAGRLGPRVSYPLRASLQAAAETGETAEARRLLARIGAAYGGRRWQAATEHLAHADALIAWREGRTDEALTSLGDVCSAFLEMDALALAGSPLLDLAELAALIGEPQKAEEAASRLGELAKRVDRDFHRSLASVAAAWASLVSGRAEQAVTEAQAALDLLADSGYRLFHARALDVLGRAQVAAGSGAASIEAFTAAAQLYGACGAQPRRDAVLDELARLGQKGRRAAASAVGVGSLTRREREVAQLAAQGLTAKEIAERLFIGQRTVETHLANAYPKLGVESKVELIRRAPELPL